MRKTGGRRNRKEEEGFWNAQDLPGWGPSVHPGSWTWLPRNKEDKCWYLEDLGLRCRVWDIRAGEPSIHTKLAVYFWMPSHNVSHPSLLWKQSLLQRYKDGGGPLHIFEVFPSVYITHMHFRQLTIGVTLFSWQFRASCLLVKQLYHLSHSPTPLVFR
jgi:hypothetical protein